MITPIEQSNIKISNFCLLKIIILLSKNHNILSISQQKEPIKLVYLYY